jgi:hypothetical protein
METSGSDHRLLVGVAITCVTALAASLIVIIDGGGEQRGGAHAATVEDVQPRAGAVDPRLRSTLGVFRRQRTAHDIVPGDPEAALQATGDRRPGENPALSRRIDLPSGPVFLWPMTNGVCHATRYGDGCVTTQTIEDKGVALSTFSTIRISDGSYREFKAFGVVRDGIGEVRFSLLDGREVTAVVHNNVFMVDLASPPTQMRWSDDAGSNAEPLHAESPDEVLKSLGDVRSAAP